MAQLTLAAAAWAKPGSTYRNTRPCDEAAGCPVARLCQNQAIGQRYRVITARPVVHDVCQVFEGGARVVEAEPVDPVTSFPESKLKGTMADYARPECTFRGCPHWSTCFDPGVVQGRKYELVQIGGKLECAMGYYLRAVTVRAAKS